MTAAHKTLPGLIMFEPEAFGDDRGFFFESYNRRTFARITGVDCEFVQDNHSFSRQGVLRGLHYQLPPRAQGKLVRVVQGEVYDVVVDIRRSSPGFGKWAGAVLSAENRRQIWIPQGFAHGFITLSSTAEFLYKITDYYAPECERSIIWNDPELCIDWHCPHPPRLSDKDRKASLFREAEMFA